MRGSSAVQSNQSEDVFARERGSAPPAGVASLHQIPPSPGGLAGRAAEIGELLGARESRGVPSLGIHGMGGVGKTALARRLVEELSPEYPDAQIGVDLRGNSSQPLAVRDAIEYVIGSIQPGSRMPEGEADLRGLYQSVLHGKRGILLIEDAGSAAQVEALTPPRTWLTIVTSRQALAVEGMFPLRLPVLSPEASLALLQDTATHVGEGDARKIAELCGHLPLVLRIAGGVLVTHPDIDPAEYARKLEDARARLELIEASLGLSYELLAPDRQRFWCALCVFPSSFRVEAAAEVWKLEPGEAKALISDLVSLSLVKWDSATSRYKLHSLVRVFTAAKLEASERETYEHRLINHYSEVFHRANSLYTQAGASTAAGLKLFDSEWPNIKHAWAWVSAHEGEDEFTRRICSVFPIYGGNLLVLRLHPRERIDWYETALAAAERLDDRQTVGTHLYALGLAYEHLGDSRRAVGYGRRYLAITRELEDREGQGRALMLLGQASRNMGHYRRALTLYNGAMATAEELGNRRKQGTLLLYIGQTLARLGQSDAADEAFLESLTIAQEFGVRQNEGSAWASLAEGHLAHGCHIAPRHLENALRCFQEIDYRPGEAGVLDSLGRLQVGAGNFDQGVGMQHQALQIYRELGDRINENKVLGNIGISYAARGEYRLALECYAGQYDLAREINDRQGLGNALFGMARAESELGDDEAALSHLEAAIAVYRSIGSVSDECRAYDALARVYRKLGRLEQAAETYKQRIAFARGIGHHGCEGEARSELSAMGGEVPS